MKVSELRKNKRGSFRLNEEVLRFLQKKKISPQKIFDSYINRKFKLDEKLKIRDK